MSYTPPSQKSNHQQVGFMIDINDMLYVSNIYHASDINFFLTPKGVLSFNDELNISKNEMADIKMLIPTYTHLLGSPLWDRYWQLLRYFRTNRWP
ncbi:hypothetical protein [Arsenophonus endosymbiont of Aleurodicus floccissimus]|uniref:hypothetical protein n=1 Tax=Arsenophonus endosymbiont of Aleurodicus floccissimus TaxID=2152761 RepID=UPI000E6B33C0|nr:hypothetical protein [Arsenophonus endosymbiont of Aleurodicus floccissimus]